MTLSKRLQHPCLRAVKGNAAPAGTRNGANRKGSGKRTKVEDTAHCPLLARSLVALIERDGTVVSLLHRPAELRAFLHGSAL